MTALHKIQSTLNVDQDPTTERYLLRAYAQLAAVVGPDAFAPYIQDALPRLVEVAQRVTPLTHGDAEDEEEDEDEEWETVQLENGDRVAIKTSALQEKSEAVQNLVILVQAIGKALSVDALKQIMQVAVPLLKVSSAPFHWRTGANGPRRGKVLPLDRGARECSDPRSSLRLE